MHKFYAKNLKNLLWCGNIYFFSLFSVWQFGMSKDLVEFFEDLVEVF